MTYIGTPLRRREDRRLLTGASRFLDDIRLPGMVHAAIVRSPHAHARVVRLDVQAVGAVSGVVAVLTGRDLGSPVPRIPALPMFPGVAQATHPLLAEDTVRYVGQPVAVVVADSRYAAEDAADAVRVEYEPRPAVVDLDAAVAAGAPVLHESLGGNVVFTREVRAGDPEAAFRDAAAVIEAAFEQPRLAGMPLECRGVLAQHHAASGRFEITLSTQSAHGARDTLAEILGVEPDRVRVIAPDVGGGFGVKGIDYPEEALAALLARRLQRPVAWAEDRLEDLRTTVQGRGQRARLRAAASADGTITAVDGEILADLGAYCYSVTALIPTLTTLVGLGAYRIRNVRLRMRGVATTKVPGGPYRGAGRPEGAYYIERLIDLVAARLGLDPADVRRRNFIQTFPYTGATGLIYDSGDYPALLDRALRLADYERWRREQARRRRDGGLPLGIGLCTWIETAGGGETWETASVRLTPSGRVTAVTGSSPHGQGLATAFSQILADGLGLTPEDVTVLHGDTDAIAEGVGTFASRSLSLGGSAMAGAASELKRRIIAAAARLLEAAPRDVVLEHGRAGVRGVPNRTLSLREIAARASESLEASARFESERVMTPSGAHVAVVEVDPDTGAITVLSYVAVNDCGRVVNPLLVEGQVHGSLAQGFAQALLEQVVYGDDGQPLTGSLADYTAPTAADLPPVVSAMQETPSPLNPLGSKGIGESGTIGAPPALVNAVCDALRPFGVQIIDMPMTPDRVWRAIRGGAASPAASDTLPPRG
ncbi:MAG TPA: xanthine dehydrogenase family protein molybdopterin-binding subunit [bacterium]|nr:xanthine dehydrogenase family protein molybdopterin-binding subunit [bacterium]